MEELAATLEELGIQNVAPNSEQQPGDTEPSKRKKKKDKGKNEEKVGDSVATSEAADSKQQPPAEAESAPETAEEADGEPEELADPKEVHVIPAASVFCRAQCKCTADLPTCANLYETARKSILIALLPPPPPPDPSLSPADAHVHA